MLTCLDASSCCCENIGASARKVVILPEVVEVGIVDISLSLSTDSVECNIFKDFQVLLCFIF